MKEDYQSTLEWAKANIDPKIDFILGASEEEANWIASLREEEEE